MQAIWAEAVRQRKPVVINGYSLPHAGEKGYPGGCVPVKRLMSVPVISENRAVMIGAFSNKSSEYNDKDLLGISLFLEAVWGIVERKHKEDALRESENKYRQLVETIQEGIWIIDKNACTDFVNPAMANMLGYKKEEMIGKQLFDFMDEQGKKLCKYLLNRRERGISEQHDFEFLKKDGARVYVTIETSSIKDPEGNYTGAKAGVMDVTERRLAEDERKILNKNIIKMLDEERHKISKDLHDGIGQFILAAKLNINIYKNESDHNPDRLDMGLQYIDNVSREIRNICDDLHPDILNDLGLEAAIRWNVRDTLESCGLSVNLNINIEKNLPHHVELNIYRIVQELISNTLKHSKAGLIQMDIRSENGFLILKYEDNGVGFSVKKIKDKKTGYGLSNIKQRVETLGGVVSIDTGPDKGTKVNIQIRDIFNE